MNGFRSIRSLPAGELAMERLFLKHSFRRFPGGKVHSCLQKMVFGETGQRNPYHVQTTKNFQETRGKEAADFL